MGVFRQTVRLESMDGQRSLEIEAVVDTGTRFSVVPASVLKDLGVTPIDRMDLTLADGRREVYDLGEVRATINGKSAYTWVAFGDDNAYALLGAYTLDGLRLMVDPVYGRLVPLTTARI